MFVGNLFYIFLRAAWLSEIKHSLSRNGLMWLSNWEDYDFFKQIYELLAAVFQQQQQKKNAMVWNFQKNKEIITIINMSIVILQLICKISLLLFYFLTRRYFEVWLPTFCKWSSSV